ncbi:MAG: 5-(carboxyamino)imidazole ribonucleotide synthase, partial [bacterium]|nr:5-(carboxyamino)imidazole ribonucleotide synthase [bacterium]
AITGLPLGATTQLSPAVMLNILGEEGGEGVPVIEGLTQVLAIPGVSFHFYGKKNTRPYRKMGHITILDERLGAAIEKAKKIKAVLKVKAEDKL